ncbi:MAG: excinuclease ABC subunit UvrA [Myxococcota bacterium]|nr:excinuclease ABC subunit UvrA [Myxococcota bacterium]
MEPLKGTDTVIELDHLMVKGAGEHNLKNVDLAIPKKRLVVFTVVSCSGKSSLAFDTLFAEGQRRYVESLSAYARQFLGQMEKPRYDSIRGLSPTISIEQKTVSRNPRSTVGTITEIHDYLRVLFARVGEQRCYSCGRAVEPQSAEQIVNDLMALPEGTKYMLLAPLVENRKGEHKDIIDDVRRAGFSRVRINGDIVELADEIVLDKNKRNRVDLVIDRLISRAKNRARVTDSVETALKRGQGKLMISVVGESEDRLFSEHRYCAWCSISFPELSPQSFSFNSPIGMCKSCNGLGTALRIDPDRVIPDPSLSVNQGAIKGFNVNQARWFKKVMTTVAKIHGIDLDAPIEKLPKAKKAILLDGTGDDTYDVHFRRGRRAFTYPCAWEGIVPRMERLWRETESEDSRLRYAAYFSDAECDACDGTRLRKESAAVYIGDKTICDLARMTIRDTHDHLSSLELTGNLKVVAAELLKEIVGRLRFLCDVGLTYLSLDRPGPTLSGGEGQRIRLASQMGSELTGVLYILDEPSIGLHARDNARLIGTLEHLRNLGNSVIVVEHDKEMMMSADWLVDFGPGAGRLGGEIVISAPPAAVAADPDSLTGAYLSGRKRIESPSSRRPFNKKRTIKITGARANNLKNITVQIPIGLFTCVTGVSGAGKSSLVNGILYPAAARTLNQARLVAGPHKALKGLEHFDKIINIDQSPIGRTPRSNPATYVKVWDDIRKVFASTREARAYGYAPGRFSFNVKGGRCETCQGAGVTKVEMHFLADVHVQCDVCHGRRFNEATLRVKYLDLTISDVLELTVDEAATVFANHRKIARILKTLQDVGLGYIKLGQPSTTLSGGEAQRIKLSRELARRATGRTLYILDEPSTGLHFEDVRKLLQVVQRLADGGNTIVMIEHNLDIIQTADWVIDIGPEGGHAGGYVVGTGTPEDIALIKESYTGQFLQDMLPAPRAAQAT